MKYTPWEIYEYKKENGVKKIHIINSLGLIVAMPTGFDYKINKRNAEHIIKSVNSHDVLVNLAKSIIFNVDNNPDLKGYGNFKQAAEDALKLTE